MTTMVERVSRAIAWASLVDDEQARFAAGNPERMWVDPKFADQARAAITAMREPTEAMVEAGNDAGLGEVPYPEIAYRTMIDAALAETGDE